MMARSVPLYDSVRTCLQECDTPISRNKLIEQVEKRTQRIDNRIEDDIEQLDVEHEISKALLDLEREDEIVLFNDWKSIRIRQSGTL